MDPNFYKSPEVLGWVGSSLGQLTQIKPLFYVFLKSHSRVEPTIEAESRVDKVDEGKYGQDQAEDHDFSMQAKF